MSTDSYITRFGLQMRVATWSNFRKDIAGASIFSMFNVAFNQFFVPMAIRDGASNFVVGLLTAAPAIGLLLSPLWAGLMEGRSPKPFAILPNFFARILVLLIVIYPKPWAFVLVAVVYNLLQGIQSPAYAGLMTRIYPAHIRGRLMGNVRVSMGLFMIPLAWLVGKWIDASGYSGSLILGSICGTISILVFSRVREVEDIPKSALTARPNWKDPLKVVRGNPLLLIFLAATSLSGFGNMLASPIYQIIQVDTLRLSNAQIGLTRVVYYIFLLLAYLFMGWVIDRLSPRRAMYVGIGVYVIAPICYVVSASYGSVLAASGLIGIGDATWDIGCMSCIFALAPGRESMAFGLHLMLFGIRGTIGPLLSTSLSHSVPASSILMAAAACGFAGLIVLTFSNRAGKPRMRGNILQVQEQS